MEATICNTKSQWLEYCSKLDQYDIEVRTDPKAKLIVHSPSRYWHLRKDSVRQMQSILSLNDGDSFVGCCMIQRPVSQNPFYRKNYQLYLVEVADVFIMPKMRRQGGFKYLIKKCKILSNNLFAAVSQDNVIAQLAFERVGFEHREHDEESCKYYEDLSVFDPRMMIFSSK